MDFMVSALASILALAYSPNAFHGVAPRVAAGRVC